MMELKAEILHLKTRDKYLSSELEGRNVQISKLKVLIDKKQVRQVGNRLGVQAKKQCSPSPLLDPADILNISRFVRLVVQQHSP